MSGKLYGRARNAAGTAAAVLLGGGLLLWLADQGPEPALYDIPRTVRYSVTVTNPTNQYVEGAEFWVFAPVAQTAFQRVAGIKATLPYKVDSDAIGNQRLLFTTNVPPYGSKTVSVDAHLELARNPNAIESVSPGAFLQAEEKIEADAEPIVELGRALTRKTEIETADAIYGWVSNNLAYAGYVRQDRGALFALTERQGDCTEYSYLFTALARSVDIATRPIGGFVTAENAVVRAADIHNWAEVQLDGKWRVVDPQNKQNRVNEHHHIAMRVLSNDGDGLSSTHQMIGTESALEIRLN